MPDPNKKPADRQKTDSPIVEAKRRLRVAALARRQEIHRAIGGAAALALREIFAAGVPMPERATIGGYWSMGAEIDVRPLMEELHARGHDCALPAVEGRGRPLVFRRWRPDDALIAGVFGTSHPAPERETLTPELLIVPLLAFDRRGFRLGYGGGFYDRTIAGLRARAGLVVVGAAFAEQEWPDIPRESFDQTLDWIATEKGVRKLGA